MKERPILFSAPMVRAILAGQKTQTRRVVKGPGWEPHHLSCKHVIQHADRRVGLQAYFRADGIGDWMGIGCPYGQPGDQLWVREAFQRAGGNSGWWYRATDEAADYGHSPVSRWRPSIHMPRAASRITLEITGIRVERLQDISDDDLEQEGLQEVIDAGIDHDGYPRDAYRALWESINGAGSWDANPWVWVVEYKRLDGGAA